MEPKYAQNRERYKHPYHDRKIPHGTLYTWFDLLSHIHSIILSSLNRCGLHKPPVYLEHLGY
jgi:hypothetical protein